MFEKFKDFFKQDTKLDKGTNQRCNMFYKILQFDRIFPNEILVLPQSSIVCANETEMVI